MRTSIEWLKHGLRKDSTASEQICLAMQSMRMSVADDGGDSLRNVRK
jgi:hypothetical protein